MHNSRAREEDPGLAWNAAATNNDNQERRFTMKRVLRPAALPLAIAAALAPAPAFAAQFQVGEVQANIDTTLSYGVAWRAQERDPSLIGIANGGTSRSVNEDNGDLNFNKNDRFANVVK